MHILFSAELPDLNHLSNLLIDNRHFTQATEHSAWFPFSSKARVVQDMAQSGREYS